MKHFAPSYGLNRFHIYENHEKSYVLIVKTRKRHLKDKFEVSSREQNCGYIPKEKARKQNAAEY